MIFVFYILAALLVLMSYRSFRGGIDYLKYFRQELSKKRSSFAPLTTVIAPIKGLDDGLTENLRAILEQDFPAFEVIFVADSDSDSAAKLVEEILPKDAESEKKVKL